MAKSKASSSKLLYAAMALCAVSLVAMIIALCVPRVERGDFTPPPFDAAALKGEPTVDEGLGYTELSHEQLSYTVWLCGRVTVSEDGARLYLMNPEANSIWLKARLLSEDGKVLGESGLLRPGEYVEYVPLTEQVSVGDAISIKVMTYEAETYRSEGAVTLNVRIVG